MACFLVSALSSYHPLSITSSVSICLRRANYGTYHLGLYQFPPAAVPSLPAIPTPPSRSLQSHQHVLPSFFIPRNVFFSPLPREPITFFFAPLPARPRRPLTLLSLSLGTIKVSAVPPEKGAATPTPSAAEIREPESEKKEKKNQMKVLELKQDPKWKGKYWNI